MYILGVVVGVGSWTHILLGHDWLIDDVMTCWRILIGSQVMALFRLVMAGELCVHEGWSLMSWMSCSEDVIHVKKISYILTQTCLLVVGSFGPNPWGIVMY